LYNLFKIIDFRGFQKALLLDVQVFARSREKPLDQL
jgi:hypothetical protein